MKNKKNNSRKSSYLKDYTNSYHQNNALNSLISDEEDFIPSELFFSSHSANEKQSSTMGSRSSEKDTFNSNQDYNSRFSEFTQQGSTIDLSVSDDYDFAPEDLSSLLSKEKLLYNNKKNVKSHELSIKISKDEKKSQLSKSISDSDLAELLIQENHLITLNSVLHYWSESQNYYIPLIGEAADKFIRLRTPTQYKRNINQRSINETLQWLKVNDSLNIDLDDDSLHRYIGFQNGVYDIDSDQLLKHSSKYFLVNIVQANYPVKSFYDNSGEHFERFLSDITEDDPELYNRLQELFGYVLSNIRDIKCIPFLVGGKDTGKSIVLKLLETLIGESAFTNLSFEQLNTPVFLAELIGKKLNTCGELGEFKLSRLDVFKKLSGGDNLLAKPIYAKPVKFKNTAALIFAGNHLPIIKGLDKANAFSNRLVIFPFTNAIPKEQQDVHLFSKLINESSYIVQWAIEGLKRWKFNNYEFTSNLMIDELIQKYASQNNSIENFIKDCCQYNTKFRTFRSEIEDAYYDYCEEKGLSVESKNLLHEQLKLDIRINHKRFRKNNENKFGYTGIGLKEVGGYENGITDY